MLTPGEVHERWRALGERLDTVILGQEAVKEKVLVCLLAGGHALLEGVPGTAKTLLALALARLLGCHARRIQFTPDLMPADLLGTNIYNQKTQEFDFRPGPIFTDVLLADEVNRTPPRTQAALLECMQEAAATVDGKRYRISPVFTVLATQNPVEFEGTYPLPEAQRDRFLMKVSIDYPAREDEARIVEAYAAGRRLHDEGLDALAAVMNREDLAGEPGGGPSGGARGRRDPALRARRGHRHPSRRRGADRGGAARVDRAPRLRPGEGGAARPGLRHPRGREGAGPRRARPPRDPGPRGGDGGNDARGRAPATARDGGGPAVAMRPGPLLPRALAWIAGGALLVPLAPPLAWAVLAAVLVTLAAAAAEALVLRRQEVLVEGPRRLVVPLGEGEVVVREVRTDASRPLRVRLRQAWPPLLAEITSERTGVVRPGEVLRFELPVRGARRGRAPLPPPALALTRLGLAERVLRAPLASEVTVVPDLRAVARLHARLNRFALRGLGARFSARLGKGREFDRLREYVRGDDFRDVAWKASARHGKLIVREYRLDRSQDVLVCLDCGHRMAGRVAGLSRLDHAVNGAVLLAYVCNRMEDRVGVLGFAAAVTPGPRPGRGSEHLRRITAFAAATAAGYVHTDYLALAAELRRRLRHRTLVVVFTALSEMDPEPLLRAVRAASPPHLVLVVALQDPELEAAAHLRPASKAELCRTLVAQDLWSVRAATVREMRRLGALVVESRPRDVGTDAMNAYIEVKRRQLL